MESKCPVCMSNDVAMSTICGHNFCMLCINEWLKDHNTCPICRSVQYGKVEEVKEDVMGINYRELEQEDYSRVINYLHDEECDEEETDNEEEIDYGDESSEE